MSWKLKKIMKKFAKFLENTELRKMFSNFRGSFVEILETKKIYL